MNRPAGYLGSKRFQILDPSRFLLKPDSWLQYLVIFNIVIISLILFFLYVNPSLKGDTNLRIGADSNYYLWHAGLRKKLQSTFDKDDVPLLAINGGVLGPELIALILRNNFLILCANYIIFIVAVRLFSRAIQIKLPLFTLLLLLNPAILVSMLTLNKEILLLLSIAMLFHYLSSKTRSYAYLSVILLVAFIGRWQDLPMFIIFLIMLRASGKRHSRRRLIIWMLVVFITLAYPAISDYADLLINQYQVERNTIAILSDAQSHFLFFAVALPKIALNMFGDGLLFLWHGIKQGDSTDIYNEYIVPITSLENMVITIWFFVKRRFSLKNNYLFFAVVYSLIVSIPPFVSGRYFIPVYVILCLELSRDEKLEKTYVVKTSKEVTIG